MFINHKRCPDCGYKLKKNDWRCRDCDNQSLTNWSLTLKIWLVFIAVIGFFVLNMVDNSCADSWLKPVMISFGVNC